MRAVANANDRLKGVFTVDWAQPAPDGSGKSLIPNEVVHALISIHTGLTGYDTTHGIFTGKRYTDYDQGTSDVRINH